MNFTSDRIRSIGWVSMLVICGAITVALTLRVNAVKSQVYAAEKRIVFVKRDIDFLETEFQTRSNQQALRQVNEIEFGYKAPVAGQYIEGERQLAALGMPAGPGAPQPIRYANADVPVEGDKPAILAMVSSDSKSPLERSEAVSTKNVEKETAGRDAATLGKRLARIEVAEAATQ